MRPPCQRPPLPLEIAFYPGSGQPHHESSFIYDHDYFDDPQPPRYRDEIEEYFSERVTMVEDPISWWREHQTQFPRLSAMALEVLLIPAMSDECERIFSSSKLILGIQRISMGDTMIGMLQCLKNWRRNRGF